MVSTNNNFKSLPDKKKLEELPLVENSYITVEGKIDDVIKFSESLSNLPIHLATPTKNILDPKKTVVVIIKEDYDWLEVYRKAHQLDTISEALTKLIGVYRAWQVDLWEKINKILLGDKK